MGHFEIETEGGPDSDPLFVETIKTVAELLPNCRTRIRYRPANAELESEKCLDHREAPMRFGEPKLRREVIIYRDVGTDLFWLCDEELESSEWAQFWGTPVAREVESALAIALDVLDETETQFKQPPSSGVIASLASALPNRIISHILANDPLELDPRGVTAEFDLDPSSRHGKLAKQIFLTLEYLSDLASSRVENEQLSHGVVFVEQVAERRANYPHDFRSLKRTPLLADGIGSILAVSLDGNAVQWQTPESLRSWGRPVSYPAHGLLECASAEHHSVALGLLPNGTIISFVKGHPSFVRRGGVWRGALWRPLLRVIEARYKDVGKICFEAAIGLTTSGHGGIFALLEAVPKRLHPKDNLQLAANSGERDHAEWALHQLLPSRSVLKLGPNFLAKLAAIDGATILTPNGELLAYGAVVPTEPSGSEGARTAAARTLSGNGGFVIKVSADGPMEFYQDGELLAKA